MVEESGTVVAVESGAVWVKTAQASTCGGCKAKQGCGMRWFSMRKPADQLRVLTDLQLSIGAPVRVGLAERALVQMAIQTYALPLLGVVIALLLSQAVAWSEGWSVLVALAGLGLGILSARWLSARQINDPRFQPVLLEAQVAGIVVLNDCSHKAE